MPCNKIISIKTWVYSGCINWSKQMYDPYPNILKTLVGLTDTLYQETKKLGFVGGGISIKSILKETFYLWDVL